MTERRRWTHPSVLALQQESEGRNPLEEIAQRAEALALEAMEAGWSGPPYDPFQLADFLGVEVVGREDLEDARLVSAQGTRRIEFNPHRRPSRVRFSLAHEIGHLLFPDHADQVRYRDRSHSEASRADDWQLEMLCNVAAAELLMPVGAFPVLQHEDLSLAHLLDLRAQFDVSTEALLRRLVRLANNATCLFAAARIRHHSGFRLDYLVPSRAWDHGVPTAEDVPPDTVLARCTAVGYSEEGIEAWGASELRVQAVGIPPYPGDRLPRVVGLLEPAEGRRYVQSVRYLRGDATQPRVDGSAIIAHVVNDRARRWSPRGFAGALMRRHAVAADMYEQWTAEPGEQRLGAVHIGRLAEDLWVASLVAQAGYGETASGRPRLRVAALRAALEALAGHATTLRASVHMPLIGTGQAGGRWTVVRDLVLSELVDRGVDVTVYVPPEQPMPDEEPEGQLTLA